MKDWYRAMSITGKLEPRVHKVHHIDEISSACAARRQVQRSLRDYLLSGPEELEAELNGIHGENDGY